MGSKSVTTIKTVRVPKTVRPGQMIFRPALVWQTMLDDHAGDKAHAGAYRLECWPQEGGVS